MAFVRSAKELPLAALYPKFNHWAIPVGVSILYAIIVTVVSRYHRSFRNRSNTSTLASTTATNGRSSEQKKKPFSLLSSEPIFLPILSRLSFSDTLIVTHNVLLCVYSAWTFANTAPQLVRNYGSRSIKDAYCDVDEQFWNSVFKYTWLFYLSKYYEIMDTVIILAKGKPSNLLQTYHHMGAIICMHVNVYYRASPTWIFVIFNSFVHTVMYFYYALTALDIRPPLFLKKSLTQLQIAQLATGTIIALCYLAVDQISGHCVKNEKSRNAIYINTSYLLPLIALFVRFAIKNYYRNRLSLAQKATSHDTNNLATTTEKKQS